MNAGYVRHQLRLIAPHLDGCQRILDFGCGDMALIGALKAKFPARSCTGIDVVDSGVRVPGVSFFVYDGKKLPFRSQSFDATICYHVLHHSDDPTANLAEIARVTKKKIFVVEPVVRWGWEVPMMKLLDRLANGWRRSAIPMPFTFQKQQTWERWAKELGWGVSDVQRAGVLPRWLPFGETKLFVLTRSSR